MAQRIPSFKFCPEEIVFVTAMENGTLDWFEVTMSHGGYNVSHILHVRTAFEFSLNIITSLNKY